MTIYSDKKHIKTQVVQEIQEFESNILLMNLSGTQLKINVDIWGWSPYFLTLTKLIEAQN